ncbi:MAG: cytochrome-c peroxidase [Anaerolineae bacterium]|nr:cytochrome-c peroxidase [Anaerolineae bacterium]
MSQTNPQPPKKSWEDQEVTRRDMAIIVGAVVVALVLVSGVLLILLNPPRGTEPAAERPAESATGVAVAPQATPAAAVEAAAPVAATATPDDGFNPADYPALVVLPPVSAPADNPITDEKVELGKLLYFDPRFSGSGSISCNSCHPAGDGTWAVGSPMSFGYPGTTHWRKSQTLYNVAYYTKLNWDGSATSIERQNDGAWQGTIAGNVDVAMVEERLAQVPEYVARFKRVFGTDFPLYSDALKAVATFQRTLNSRNVPFDRYLQGETNAISAEAKRGYELFTGKARCIACHNGPLLSDNSFHNTGVPTPAEWATNPLRQITVRWQFWSRGANQETYNTAKNDHGLALVTGNPDDLGKFRTPSLREVCYHPPYMHNGELATLEDVVAFYNQGGGNGIGQRDPLIQPLNLSAEEQRDLVAFLQSLCGDKIIIQAPQLPAYGVIQP